jgi:hypothetical protein
MITGSIPKEKLPGFNIDAVLKTCENDNKGKQINPMITISFFISVIFNLGLGELKVIVLQNKK